MKKEGQLMSDRKYELITSTKITLDGKRLYRPKALKSFACQWRKVKEGDIGGFIQSENNLSQEGTCWVFDKAIVYDQARVTGDAMVSCEAKISDKVEVSEKARVTGSAAVRRNAKICGNSIVSEYATITDYAVVADASVISGETVIKNYTELKGKTLIRKWGSLDAGHFYNPKSPKLTGTNFIDNSVIIGPVHLDINNAIKNSYICGNLYIKNSRIEDTTIGLRRFDNLWDEFSKLKIEDAEIYSSKQILITPLKFVSNTDEEKVPFIWYKRRTASKGIDNFFRVMNKKSVTGNEIKQLFRKLSYGVEKDSYFEAIKKFLLKEDTEITNIPLLTVREILKREGVNDPKIEANILLQDKITYYILSYFLGAFLCFCDKFSCFYCEEKEELDGFLENVINDAEIDMKENIVTSINHIPIEEDDGAYELIKQEINDLKGSV